MILRKWLVIQEWFHSNIDQAQVLDEKLELATRLGNALNHYFI
jgi:hypothetical protein